MKIHKRKYSLTSVSQLNIKLDEAEQNAVNGWMLAWIVDS